MSSVPPFEYPVVITSAGLQPQAPAYLLQLLTAAVAAQVPGYTNTLPGSLIEDVSSTSVYAVALCDQAKVDTVNSLTPLMINEALIIQQGQMLGLEQGQPTNTSVPVVFSGTVGYVVPNGFLVGDGTYSYQVQGGGPILSGGSSATLTAIATQSGSWGVAANTVTTLQTSVPSNITLSVNNPSAGTAGSASEPFYVFRARVLQAMLAACVGSARMIKTLLGAIGCASNAISVQQVSGGGIRVVAGGPDEYAIAFAILSGVADPTELQGSAVDSGRNVTVSLYDYPDTYSVKYVATQTQTVTMTITWNTSLSSFTGANAIPGLVQQPIVTYINALAPGQPINLLEINELFQESVSGLIDPALITRLAYSVYINGSGTPTPPASGYQTIVGDAESNWLATTSGITVTQG